MQQYFLKIVIALLEKYSFLLCVLNREQQQYANK